MNILTTIKPDKAGVIIFPPLLYLLALIIGISLKFVFPTPLLSATTALIIGAVMLSIAIVILRVAVRALAKQNTTINPGGVTTSIVSNSIYQFTRNPMYLSFTLIYIAVLIMVNSWLGFLLLIPLLMIVHNGIIKKEEKYLTQKFGEEYLKYTQKVNRWF